MTRFAFLVAVTLFTLAGVCLGSSNVHSQSLKDVQVNITFKNTALDVILDELERQSGFSFTYPQEIGKLRPFNINVKNESLYTALQQLSTNNRLIFKQNARLISVSLKKSPERFTVKYLTKKANHCRVLP